MLSFFGPVPSNTEAESPFFDMWSKLGVDLCEPDQVAREILATIRKRRQVHVMGGGTLKMLTIANAISPSIADAMGLRKIWQAHAAVSPTLIGHEHCDERVACQPIGLPVPCKLWPQHT
jgi:hypothetical protein